jgi:hypothetical protein
VLEKDVEASPTLKRHMKKQPLSRVSEKRIERRIYIPDKEGSSSNYFTEEARSRLSDHTQQEGEDRDQEGIVETSDSEEILGISLHRGRFGPSQETHGRVTEHDGSSGSPLTTDTDGTSQGPTPILTSENIEIA